MSEETKKLSARRKLSGKVVSDKNNQTVVVEIVRRFKHPRYSKYVHETKKYHAHDPSNSAKTGEQVTIVESKAHSKLKKWELYCPTSVDMPQ